jgi:flagellar protein FlbB
MANQIKKPPQGASIKSNEKMPAKPKSKKGKRIRTFLLVVFVLLLLAGASFAAGVYLNMVDIQKLKLYEYPLIGQYFPKPVTSVDRDEEETTDQIDEQKPQIAPPIAPKTTVEKPTITPPIDEKTVALLKQQEAKRISKVAKLYGDMKPDEAVAIMAQLDNDTVLAILNKMEEEQVAKILALFDPKRSANLTKEMLKGKAPIPLSL